MYLLDTNVVMELLLNQERADEVEQFLQGVSPDILHITEFALDSMGIILLRRQMHEAFLRAVDDLVLTGGVQVLRLGLHDMQAVVQASRQFTLDFDDAYQYVAAEKYDLTLVSFDGDFDRTERGRQTPGQALAAMTDQNVET